MMILLPEWITVQDVEHAKESVAEKKPGLDLGAVHVLDLDEGHSVQFLFIGPYLEEAPVIEELHHVYLPAHGLTPRGRHHEIYLSDPRRTAPATLRTILRQPVE